MLVLVAKVLVYKSPCTSADIRRCWHCSSTVCWPTARRNASWLFLCHATTQCVLGYFCVALCSASGEEREDLAQFALLFLRPAPSSGFGTNLEISVRLPLYIFFSLNLS